MSARSTLREDRPRGDGTWRGYSSPSTSPSHRNAFSAGA